MISFMGSPVLGIADSDLFFYWSLFKLLDDNMGENSVMMSPSIHPAWLALINSLDDAIASSFLDDGTSSLTSSKVLFFSDLD